MQLPNAGRRCLTYLAFVLAFFTLCFATALTALWILPAIFPPQYAIVVDAGSTHTSVHLYSWLEEKRYFGTASKVREVQHCEHKKGVSEFNDAWMAADSVESCIREISGLVPQSIRPTTPAYFAATAGMRVLKTQNNQLASDIIVQLSQRIQAVSGMQLKTSRIISGAEEAAFAWVTANYLDNRLLVRGDPKEHSIQTVGLLDAGGASSQITFRTPTNESNPNVNRFSQHLRLYGIDYLVYAQSTLCYGSKQAELQFIARLIQAANFTVSPITSPCHNKGYERRIKGDEAFIMVCLKSAFTKYEQNTASRHLNTTFTIIGGSGGSKCTESLKKLFGRSICDYQRCSFNNALLPEVPLVPFFAPSGTYIYTSRFFNATPPKTSSESFRDDVIKYCLHSTAATRELYEKKGDDLGNKFLEHYCFQGSYVYMLLTYGYRLEEKNWNLIRFEDKIDDTKIGWSLGLLLNETGLLPIQAPRYPHIPINYWYGFLGVTLFGVAVLIGVVLLVIYFHYRARYRKSEIPN